MLEWNINPAARLKKKKYEVSKSQNQQVPVLSCRDVNLRHQPFHFGGFVGGMAHGKKNVTIVFGFAPRNFYQYVRICEMWYWNNKVGESSSDIKTQSNLGTPHATIFDFSPIPQNHNIQPDRQVVTFFLGFMFLINSLRPHVARWMVYLYKKLLLYSHSI